MEKLRFHDNDSQIIDEIEHLVSTIREFYDDEYNSPVIDDLSTIMYNDIFLELLASDILAGDYSDDGAYVYTLGSKYLANRKVDYAELRFKYVLETYPNCTFTQEENIAVSYIVKLIALLRYVLKYSYRATHIKKLKVNAKKPQHNRVKSTRSPRPARTDEEYRRNKELLGSIYGTIATNSFDDYPSFIGSFAQPNPIPCDGEDQ